MRPPMDGDPVTNPSHPIEPRAQLGLPRPVFRQRFEVEVVWTQPHVQDYADDWGSNISDALAGTGCCLFDIQESDVQRLVPVEDDA